MTRDFELTGPTIKKYLLGKPFGYFDAHVFLITPFDENSHKLSALAGTNLVSVRVFNDFNINESLYPTSFLRGAINGGQVYVFISSRPYLLLPFSGIRTSVFA
jgi:hypothetical protein